MTYVLCFCRYEAMVKEDIDAFFTSLQDNNEKLCVVMDWLLDAIAQWQP